MEYDIKRKNNIIQLNLINVGKMAVKSLIDRSCFDVLDDRTSEVLNFCNVIENLFYFAVKGGEPFYNPSNSKHPWIFVRSICKNLSNCNLLTIQRLENLKNNFAKLRAWIRYSLLEKRLHEYLEYAVSNITLVKKFYTEESFFLSFDAMALINTLMGLKTIDFNFDLKGENLNYPGFIPVDYTPYLRFIQSPLSVLDDLVECGDHSLENSSTCPWKAKYFKVETKLKAMTEQKGYLEEIVRVQDGQLTAAENAKKEAFIEIKQMESIVLELQVQLTLLHEQYKRELSRLSDLSGTDSTTSNSSVSFHLPPPRAARSRVSLVTQLPPISPMVERRRSQPNMQPTSTQHHQVSWVDEAQVCGEEMKAEEEDEVEIALEHEDVATGGEADKRDELLTSCRYHDDQLQMVEPGRSLNHQRDRFSVGRQEMDPTTFRFQTPPRASPSISRSSVAKRPVLYDASDDEDCGTVDNAQDVLQSGICSTTSKPSSSSCPDNTTPTHSPVYRNGHLPRLSLAEELDASISKMSQQSNPNVGSLESTSDSTVFFSQIDSINSSLNAGASCDLPALSPNLTPEVIKRLRQEAATQPAYYHLMDDCVDEITPESLEMR